MGDLRTGNALMFVGLVMVIVGGGFMLWTAVEAQSSTSFQIGQAIGVWPEWVFEQIATGLFVAFMGLTVAWYGMGHGRRKY